MLKSLVSSKCINFERLLVLKAKELGLDGNECHILLLIYALKGASVRLITPAMLQNYSLLSTHDLNKVLQSLLSKKFIYNRSGAISLNHLEERSTDLYVRGIPPVRRYRHILRLPVLHNRHRLLLLHPAVQKYVSHLPAP